MQQLEREVANDQPRMHPGPEEVDDPATASVSEAFKKSGDPKYDELLTLVSREDAMLYRDSVFGLGRFEKTYELFGGKVVLTFSNFGPDEDQQIVTQEAIDMTRKRVNGFHVTSLVNATSRYAFAASLRDVYLSVPNVRPVEIPPKMTVAEYLMTLDRDKLKLAGVEPEDTNIRFWYYFLARVALPGSLYRVAFEKYLEFRENADQR